MQQPARWIASFAALGTLLAAPALAATFTANSTADGVDAAPGDGVCATAAGACTLRAAVQEANGLGGADTIVLPAGVYILSIGGTFEDASATGDLDVTETLTVEGAGAGLSIVDANDNDRHFDLLAGTLSLSGLALRDGSVTGSDGGSISVATGTTLLLDRALLRGNRTNEEGGAIDNEGTVTVTRTTFRSNHAGDDGGAIINEGAGASLTIAESTFEANRADSRGGAIQMTEGTIDVTNSTFSRNTAGDGGAIVTFDGALTVLNATFARNSAPTGGAISNNGGTVTLRNTILRRGADGGNCLGPVTSLGNNLDNGSSCALAGPGDLSDTDPLLGPLADNGGPTETHALLAGSPAIDAGSNAGCPGGDQRGVGRPMDGDGNGSLVCDIGAFELEGAPVPALGTGGGALLAGLLALAGVMARRRTAPRA